MPNISFLDAIFDVNPLRAQLEANPNLWNQYRWRTENPRSPHREVSDIWVRYNAVENVGPHFNDPHESVWYPVIHQIPEVLPIIHDVLNKTQAVKLGGVLITRIPPGKQVYPHIDQGWHANYYEKFAVQIQGNDRQAFCFEDEFLSAKPGECYWFDNHYKHWVINDSDEDRVTLIICIRRSN